jgi:hypothetical protein
MERILGAGSLTIPITVLLVTFGLSWSAATEQRRSYIALNGRVMLQQTNARDSA